MLNVYRLKIDIEEIRQLLNISVSVIDINDSNYNTLLDISTKMDKLIVEYMKIEVS